MSCDRKTICKREHCKKGKLKPHIEHLSRIVEEHDKRCNAEGVERIGFLAEELASHHHERHDCGANDRRLASREQHVEEQAKGSRDDIHVARKSQQRAHHCEECVHDDNVRAGDCENVRDAGVRERKPRRIRNAAPLSDKNALE